VIVPPLFEIINISLLTTLNVTPLVLTIPPPLVTFPTWKVGAANTFVEYNTPLSSIANELLGPINTEPVDT
jgi:hypothetical protein